MCVCVCEPLTPTHRLIMSIHRYVIVKPLILLSTEVPEDYDLGRVVWTVRATDDDSPSTPLSDINFRLVSATADYFSLHPRTGRICSEVTDPFPLCPTIHEQVGHVASSLIRVLFLPPPTDRLDP